MKNPEFRTAWERNTVVSLILWTQPLPQSQSPVLAGCVPPREKPLGLSPPVLGTRSLQSLRWGAALGVIAAPHQSLSQIQSC